jgi:hypothetical protein
MYILIHCSAVQCHATRKISSFAYATKCPNAIAIICVPYLYTIRGPSIHIVTRKGVCAWLLRWFLDWMIGFIHVTRDYRQYSAIADLHISQFTVTHALGSSLSLHFSYPSNGFISLSLPLPNTHEVIFAPSNYCHIFSITLDCHLQNSTQFMTTTHSNDLLCLSVITRHGPRRKRSLSIVEKACLLIRCLAMGLYVIIQNDGILRNMVKTFLYKSCFCLPWDMQFRNNYY